MDAGHKGKRTSRNETEWRWIWPITCKSFVYFRFPLTSTVMIICDVKPWYVQVLCNTNGMDGESLQSQEKWGKTEALFCRPRSTPERMYDFLLNHFYSLWINIPMWRSEGTGLEHWVSNWFSRASGSTVGGDTQSENYSGSTFPLLPPTRELRG